MSNPVDPGRKALEVHSTEHGELNYITTWPALTFLLKRTAMFGRLLAN